MAAPTAPTITALEEIQNMIGTMEPIFQRSLPDHMTAMKFAQHAKIAVAKDAKLQEAERASIYSAIQEAAQDGLFLDGREAAILVFNVNVGSEQTPRWIKRAKYMPMVQGILKKVRNSGELATLASQVVHEKDKFRFWVDDTGEHIQHEPVAFGDRGPMVGVYAMARLRDGSNYAELLSKEQVEKVKAKSKAQKSLMWTDFMEEGWRKSAIRRLSKRLPMSSDVVMVIQRDDDLYDLETPADTAKAATTSSRLKNAIQPAPAAKPPAQEPEPEEPPPPEPSEEDVPV